MGLFDKAFGKKEEGPINFSQQEAFSAVCLLAVSADGVVESDEVHRIITNLVEKRLFRGYNMDSLASILNNSAKLIQRRGAAPVMEAARKALSQDLRETAFVLATDLVLADGYVDPKEKAFLEEFHKSLGISDELAVKIAEVIVIKNRS
ncbi:MAG: Tellurite resistance protein TerB [SAR202 cluster bacterium]|nr:Tellurite resistance protein TerB [SAR202 cluster bacterium]